MRPFGEVKGDIMANYHLSMSAVKRSAGRSSVASSAYRAAEKIVDERTGEIHDYCKKDHDVYSEVCLPDGGTINRAELWNNVEQHHKRSDAVVAREIEVSLPKELTPEDRRQLAVEYGRELADRYGVAADVSIHDKDGNPHAHILMSACYCDKNGNLGKKAVELDPIHCQRKERGLQNPAERERGVWATKQNLYLENAGRPERVDHRSLSVQGIDREPQIHVGPAAKAMQARGIASDRAGLNRDIIEQNTVKELFADSPEPAQTPEPETETPAHEPEPQAVPVVEIFHSEPVSSVFSDSDSDRVDVELEPPAPAIPTPDPDPPRSVKDFDFAGAAERAAARKAEAEAADRQRQAERRTELFKNSERRAEELAKPDKVDQVQPPLVKTESENRPEIEPIFAPKPTPEIVKPVPEPPPPVDLVQQLNDRQHELFGLINQIESQYRQGLPDYEGRIKTVQAETSEAVKVERITGKELEAWAKYGEERGWKQGQSFQRPTGLLNGKEKEAFDRWKADYDLKVTKATEATRSRMDVERTVSSKVQSIRQEQGAANSEIRRRVEADPRIKEARAEIMKGMDRKEQIQHPERSRSRDRGGIDMELQR